MNVKASINNSIINLDPNSVDNKNINVGNDIIVRKKFRVRGYNYDIDIPFLRYIKNLPLHFVVIRIFTTTKKYFHHHITTTILVN